MLLFVFFDSPGQKKQLIYAGTYSVRDSKGIYVIEFTPESEKMKIIFEVVSDKNPSFLSLHPGNKYLYAVSQSETDTIKRWGQVCAFQIDQHSGNLTLINKRPSYGQGPCYIQTDKTGRWLFVANYNSGSLAMYPILADGAIGEVSDTIWHKGKGVNPQRQEKSHLHSAIPGPENQYVFFPDLGTDKIMIYKLDLINGKLSPGQMPWVKVKDGSGPRHFEFHPNRKFAYLAEELNSSVSAFRYTKESGILTEKQSLSTLPEDFKGENTVADIHVHPNGSLLYVSNRGHNSLACYTIDPADGTLKLLGFESTRGIRPRNFMIHPNGDYLFVANRDSDNIVLFRIDQTTGKLTYTGKELKVPAPVCLKMMFLN